MITPRKQHTLGEGMHAGIRSAAAMLAAGLVLLATASPSKAQQAGIPSIAASTAELPDVPEPQFAADRPSSSSQEPATPQSTDKDQYDKAEEQLKQQEQQRVGGVMPTFNTTSNKNALPLSPGQKFRLFFRGSIDPWPFALAGVVAGIGQAKDSHPEWGQGAQGYAKRYGAAYTDTFIGNFFGNAVLPSLLHEDPRYFQKRQGRVTSRILWAASSTVGCRRDNGAWGPNYANITGNLIGSAIARTYYPASERTVGATISDGLTVLAEGIVGTEVIEFWPDIARHFKQKRDKRAAREAAEIVAPETPSSSNSPSE